MKSGKEIKHYKVTELPTHPSPDSIYYVKSAEDVEISTFITNLQGIPYPLHDQMAAGVNTIVNTDGYLSIVGTDEVFINLSPAMTALLNSKENISNKVNTISGNSSIEYPTENAVVVYVSSITDLKANDDEVIHTTGDETKDGSLTLNDNLVLPDLASSAGTINKIGTTATGQVVIAPDNLRVAVTNKTGSSIPIGSAVYINGAQGSKATIALALADSNIETSAAIGIVENTIPNNGNGYIISLGEVSGLNTSSFVNGDKVFVSPTTAGGLTNIAPTSPNNVVFVGTVTNSHATQGKIIINVLYTFKLDRLVDVAITSATNRQLLTYDSVSGLWKNSFLNYNDIVSALGYAPENIANKGIANGYASLDSGGKVPSTQLPSYVDDVVEYTNLASFPVTGVAGIIYVALDTNRTYRWSGSTYIEVSPSDVNSVNTKTGIVVLDTSDILDTTNKRYQTDNQKLFNDATSSIQTQLDSKALDSNVLHKTGNESWTGIKSSINTGGGSINGISLINNGTSTSSNSLNVTNNDAGVGIVSINSSNGDGIYSDNTDVGIGIHTQNTSNGQGLYSNNMSNGYGIYSDNISGYGIYSNNVGIGVGLYVNNTSSGNAILVDGGFSATGFNYIGRNNGTNTFTVNKLGDVTTNRFIKSGGTSSQFLKADGSVDSSSYALTSALHNPVTIGTANGLSLSTQILSLGLSSTSTNGALSFTDWNTFNNKQAALSGTGFVKASGTTITYDNTIYVPSTTTLNINGNSYDLSANREWRVAQGDTGCLTDVGLSTNSGTTINIGAVTGYIVDNETNPDLPTYVRINYSGETNKTVTTIGSGTSSYVMLGVSGISFQTTFPTSAERKAKIWLGKVGHPNGTITVVANEPDYINSPQSFSRDLFQALSPYINNNVYPYANGANLSINITGGTLFGNGINFVNSRTNPNALSVGAVVATPFLYRTQLGGATGAVTSVSAGFYDNAGVITAVGGGSNSSTNQYVFAVPGQGFVIQYGQTVYTTLNDAVAAIGKESITVFSNLINNSILIGVISINKNATQLNNTAQALFFKADKFGQIIGATSGTSTGTLQTAYNNSPLPQIIPTDALGAFTLKNGRALDTSTIIEGKNIASTTTFSIKGNGEGYFGGNVTISPSDSRLLGGDSAGRFVISNSTTSSYIELDGNTHATSNNISLVTTNGKIGLFTNTLERLTVLNNGNVGIGTTSPNYKLDVQGDIAIPYGSALRARDYTYSKLLETGYNATLDRDFLKVYTAGLSSDNAIEKITILSDGSVGIGTTAPSSILHIAQIAPPTVTIQALGSGSNASPLARKINFSNYLNAETASIIAFDYNQSVLASELAFNVSNDAAVLFEAMRINRNGNVGIGITAPSTKLEVNGNINANGVILGQGPVIGLFNMFLSNSDPLSITSGSANIGIGRFTLYQDTTGSSNIAIGYGSLSDNISGNTNTAVGVFSLTMNIAGTDNVAIGNEAGKNTINPNTSVFIGAKSDPLSENQSNQIVIGYNTVGAGSNTVTIGNTSITKTVLRGVVSNSKTYTVATLPSGVLGDTTVVTDALAPTFLGVVVGGGSVVTPVFYNGGNWVAK